MTNQFIHDDTETDITILSRAELETRVQERTAYLDNLMHTMPDLLFQLDENGEIQFANDTARERLGYDPDTLQGNSIEFVFADTDENERLTDTLASGELIERLLVDGQVTEVEAIFETADGTLVPMDLSASVIQDDSGVFSGLVCVATDISDRKKAQERAEFLHSLLRHDVRNKLQVANGYLDALAETDLSPEQMEMVEKISDGIQDGSEIIEKVQTLQKLDERVELDSVSLDRVLRNALGRHDDLQEYLEITTEYDVDPSVTVQGGELLTELFANLLENCLRHSGGSTLRITLTEHDDEVVVSIADDGSGIPDDEKHRIFERGYHHGDTGGSGQGMYLVREIAETYGGSVAVEDSELGGTRFAVTLRSPSSTHRETR